MYLFALALRHPHSPIIIREKFAILNKRIDIAYAYFNQKQIPAFILSTCNRSEIYIYLPHNNLDEIIEWWADFCGENPKELSKYINVYENEQAILHLFEVGCGIDSMVLGETQISKQIKDAYLTAQKNKSLNSYLHAIIQKAVKCSKAVRTQTDIGKFSVSFAAAGVLLAQKIFSNLFEHNILFIGAGEMMQTISAHFCAQNPKNITIINRSQENAIGMVNNRLSKYADKIQIKPLTDLANTLHEYDIVVCCIEYNNYIIDKSLIEKTLKLRKFKPMYVLDLSVPLVIDSNINDISDIFLYNVDDLSHITEQGQNKRLQAKSDAKSIINQHLNQYLEWQKHHASLPLIQQIQTTMQKQVQECLEYAHKQKQLGKDDDLVLAQSMNKFMQLNAHHWLQTIPFLTTEQQKQLQNYFDKKV